MSVPHSADGDTTDETETRAARRALVLFAVAVVASIAALVVTVFTRDDGPVTVEGTTVVTTGIGPAGGDDLSSFLSQASAELAAAEGTRVAVVSFEEYVTDTDAYVALGGIAVRELLVAVPGGVPVRAEDAFDARREAVADAEDQVRAIEELLPTVTDGSFAAFYRAELARFEAIIENARRDDIVFGAVVVASVAELRGAVSRPEVRSVFLGAGPVVDDDAVLRGVRPEETSVAGEPQTRPV